ncbi:MAG: hypothetical protein A2234_10460 [Elusimicrobia bacterium RIFOXYA2_FULL_58_8]|nr:MAG: hypothetical protein A2285_05780 [Elusimicrobia bacterium RIFOXYA12_FULL_57_11]OGS14585.1 MAG: hypothetical protein A2234_10460 [Elusimicrobia bacterium RIFOXYA2_FULL_58_8]
MAQTIQLKCGTFNLTRLLGKGKSGHSWLIENGPLQYVLKRMHNEPCAYYQFGDKLAAELAAYQRLQPLINLPRLVEHSAEGKYLVKEYIPGPPVSELAAQGAVPPGAFAQLFRWCRALYPAGINLDYFPANFVCTGKELFYVDYELNPYSEEWNFENWGLYYWLNAAGMRQFLSTGDHLAINLPGNKGKPITAPFTTLAQETITKYRQ